MGKGSSISAYTSLKIANNLKEDGKYTLAEKELGLENLSGISKARALQLASICRVMSGGSESIKIAKQSTDILQKEQSSLSLLASSYCIQGIAHFFEGDFNDAEDYLSLAARWSENSTQQAIAYGNLGALMWLRNDLNGDSVNNYYKRALYKRLSSPIKGEKIGLSIDINEEIKNKANEALGYWLEGMENATNPNSNYEVSGCGPVVSAAGPGIDPIFVKKDKKDDNNNKKMDNLDYNLKDVKFTIAYVTLLNNIADAYHLLDNIESRSETLSSALKAIEKHKDNIACASILGRTLGIYYPYLLITTYTNTNTNDRTNCN